MVAYNKNIKVARDRNGEFYPRVLERYQRREEKIDKRIIELFIGGISTRKMKKITRDLFGKGYSAATISRINKQLTEEMRTWMEVPIEDNIKYIYLDGLNLPVKRLTLSKESLLMAIGITTDGYRKILAVQLGDRESASSWREFLRLPICNSRVVKTLIFCVITILIVIVCIYTRFLLVKIKFLKKLQRGTSAV